MQKLFNGAWTFGVLFALAVAFVLAASATDAPIVPRGDIDTPQIHLAGAVSVLPFDSTPLLPTARATSDSNTERPFPLIPLVGAVLIVMTLALHRAARQWTH